jgi:hypothetical protein
VARRSTARSCRCGKNCQELYRLDDDPHQLDSHHETADVRTLQGWLERLAHCSDGSCQRYESQ